MVGKYGLTAALILLCTGTGALWWWSSRPVSPMREGGDLSVRRRSGIHEVKPKKPREKRANRKTAEAIKADRKKPDLSLDSEDESLLKGEMKRLFSELQSALDVEDKKSVFSVVAKMQNLDEWPDGIPLSVKLKALEALKWFGADGIPAVVGFAGDGNPQVQQESVDALTEMLSDASLGDRATSEIIKQLVKVIMDRDALDTIMMSLNDMRNSVRVDTAQAIYGSGNEVAISVLDENVEFLFCDGEIEVKGKGDLEAYRRANPDDPEDDEMYGPLCD